MDRRAGKEVTYGEHMQVQNAVARLVSEYGLAEVAEAVDNHRRWAAEKAEWDRREQAEKARRRPRGGAERAPPGPLHGPCEALRAGGGAQREHHHPEGLCWQGFRPAGPWSHQRPVDETGHRLVTFSDANDALLTFDVFPSRIEIGMFVRRFLDDFDF